MLIATTEGLTIATTSAILGNAAALLPTAGREKPGSIGVAVGEADGAGDGLGEGGLGDGTTSIPGSAQPAQRNIDVTMIIPVKRDTKPILLITIIF